jgi:hypothetical protein
MKKSKKLIKEREEVVKDVGIPEMIYDTIAQKHEHDTPMYRDRDIHRHRPMNITSGRRIEDEYEICNRRRKNSTGEFFKVAEKYLIPLKNRFSELEVEEAISESNSAVDEFLSSGSAVELITDKIKRINYREKLKAEVDFTLKGYKREDAFNQFAINNNSNANKKYDVVNISVYLKILVALRILRVYTKKAIYSSFGLKLCQSKYMIKSITSTIKKYAINKKFEVY